MARTRQRGSRRVPVPALADERHAAGISRDVKFTLVSVRMLCELHMRCSKVNANKVMPLLCLKLQKEDKPVAAACCFAYA